MERYYKLVDHRRGKTKGTILNIVREKNGKYSFVDKLSGEWLDAPNLEKIFTSRRTVFDNYVPATEQEAKDFIASIVEKFPPKSEKPMEKKQNKSLKPMDFDDFSEEKPMESEEN